MENKYKVLGICTDVIKRDGKIFLKNGKRQYGAVGWYRVFNPLKKLGAELSIGLGVKTTIENAEEMKKKGDIWFCKMADNEGIDHIYGAHKDYTGAKFVLDLDDDPINTDIAHPDFKELEDRKGMRIRMVKMADHVVVSTQAIKDVVKEINPNISIIPNSIDPKIWKVKKKKRTDGKIRIGWISSGSHYADLPLIEDVIEDILKKYPNVEFHFAGMHNNDTQGDRVFHHRGTNGYKDFPQFYADLDFDIAIAPLKDTVFNRAKSNIKWLEASMLEIPMVASDVLPYRDIKHGKTGYLASTPNQMTKYLSWLIENPEKRKQMGKEAKKEVLDKWTIDKYLPLYKDLFDGLNDKKEITVVTAIAGDKDKLREQPQYKGVEYVAFLEKEQETSWKTRKICDKFVKPVMNAKIHKVLTHKYIDTEYIVWLDGNCKLMQDPHELVKLMGKSDGAFFKHSGRNCIYQEADACVSLNKGNYQEIGEQINKYLKELYPLDNGLSELTCFIRKNTPKMNNLFEKWWAEICRHSERDQISFPYIMQGKKFATIPGKVADMKDGKLIQANEFFDYKPHKK